MNNCEYNLIERYKILKNINNVSLIKILLEYKIISFPEYLMHKYSLTESRLEKRQF